VRALNAAGMYVILDMHFSSRGGAKEATGQVPMPDERYAPAFWTSVARAFEGNPAVIFDLFNEPYPNHDTDSAAAWTCDLEGSAGGTCRGFAYQAAGMQQLVDSVRATGATNVIMVAGPQFAGDLDHWLQYEPHDPLGQLAASIHIYWDTPSHPDFSPCYSSSCWTSVLAPLSATVPIVVGEFGELDCGDTLYLPFLAFADRYGLSYLGWAWFVGSCARGPSLISNYSGTATAFGIGYQEHLASLTK
jgi:endoglucanase